MHASGCASLKLGSHAHVRWSADAGGEALLDRKPVVFTGASDSAHRIFSVLGSDEAPLPCKSHSDGL